MALNKTALKTGIRTIADTLWANVEGLTPEQCREKFATDLSNLIEAFVKTGAVSVSVTTVGSATTQSGSGTGTIS